MPPFMGVRDGAGLSSRQFFPSLSIRAPSVTSATLQADGTILIEVDSSLELPWPVAEDAGPDPFGEVWRRACMRDTRQHGKSPGVSIRFRKAVIA